MNWFDTEALEYSLLDEVIDINVNNSAQLPNPFNLHIPAICIPSVAFFAWVINTCQYRFGFGNECGNTQQYSLCGFGPNGDDCQMAS